VKIKKISLKKRMKKTMLKMKLNLWRKKKMLMGRKIYLENKRVNKKNISNLLLKKMRKKKEILVIMLLS